MKSTPIVLAATLLAAVLLSACGQKPEGAHTAAGCKDAAGLRALVKDPAAVTHEQYLAVLESYACCAVDPEKLALDNKTCATAAVLKTLKDDKVKLPPIGSVLDKLVAHSAPQVRAVGYGRIALLMGSGEAGMNAAKKALATETDPYALRALVRGVQNAVDKVPEAGAFLLKAAAHEHPQVRAAAAAALASSKAAKVPGALDAVVTLLGDRDTRVRKAACSHAGNLGAEAVIAPITGILGDAAQAAIHSDCVRGLTQLWLDAPGHHRTSAAAYKATLDYYKATPRSSAVPAAKAIPLAGEFGARADVDAWRAKASYYKPAEIIATMTDILKDENASQDARSNAIRLIGKTGGAAALDKLAPAISALSGDKAASLKDSYTAAVKSANRAANKATAGNADKPKDAGKKADKDKGKTADKGKDKGKGAPQAATREARK